MKDCGVPSFAEIEVNFDDFQAQALINKQSSSPYACLLHGDNLQGAAWALDFVDR